MSLEPDSCVDDTPPDHTTSTGVFTSYSPAAVEPVELPGVELKRRREERGLTIEDVSRTTKINKAVLRALEATDVSHLPAAIYTRGFVKAYAREVGLDPEHTADDYLHRIEPLRGPQATTGGGSTPVISPRPAIDVNGDMRHVFAENQVSRFGRLTLAVAAIGIVVYLASFTRGDESTTAVPTDVADGIDATRAGGTIPSDARGDAVASAASSNEPLRVEFIPRGPCWLSIHIDGERVFAKLLQPGERQTFEVLDEAVLRIGEPSALSYSINGQSGRTLGPAGQPVTVRINKDNFRDFLSS